MSARLRVRVHAGAKREGVRGWMADGTLRIEVTAPPEGGSANRAVTELLARLLGIRRAQVEVVRGESSRLKWIECEGLSEAELRQRIERALIGREADDGE